ncbi:MAG: heavy metal sensor histidine kinase [Verrucomicrobiota bacterium]|nr:heavy metal sensor histidine kinase [Verrucomicrobiota bacterium]
MSSSRSSTRSIAARLVFLFTIAAVLLLCAGLGLLYWIVVQHAVEEDNEVLADKAYALRADLESSGGPAAVRDGLDILRAGERAGYLVRILDAAGNVRAESRGMAEVLPANVFPVPESRVDQPTTHHAGGRLFGCVTLRHAVNGQSYTIQVAQDRSADEQFRRRFALLLVAVVAGGLIASAFIAITVTRSGLQPLAELTHSIESVGPTRLHERVPATGWPRELQPVVLAFDEMLDRLEDSFTRLSQFSADLAHELRTPVGNLRGEAEVALRRERSPDEYREVIESSVAECQRLSGIIDSLLFLARAEAADRTLECATFDARVAVEKIADYYGTIAEERHITVECTGEGEIHADGMLFGRAVSNLIDNALRHTSDNGRIEIAIAALPEHTQVSERDNGSGIAAEHLPRVFDRLYRADPSRSSEGSGLGLALVKSIVTLHGGKVKIASEVGEGTEVTMLFPT